MDGTGGRLHHHRVLVGTRVGDAVVLGGVGHQARPSTSRRRCRRRSRSGAPGGQLAEGGVLAEARPTRGGTRRQAGSMWRGTQPSTGSITARAPGGSTAPAWSVAAVVEHAHHLVAGDEGEADDVLEVARAAPVHQRQVGPADAGQQRSQVRPVVGRGAPAGRRRGAAAGRHRRHVPIPTARRPGRRRTGGGCARRPGPSLGVPGRGPCGRGGRPGEGGGAGGAAAVGAPGVEGPEGQQCAAEPPAAFSQCSTCQPRRRAMAASLVSGLTATGNPTASSMGRSLAEWA